MVTGMRYAKSHLQLFEAGGLNVIKFLRFYCLFAEIYRVLRMIMVLLTFAETKVRRTAG